MFEKLKDIMYDVSDILFSLLIVAVIFSVVSWKISDSLAFEIKIPEKSEVAQQVEMDPELIEIQEVENDITGEAPQETASTDAQTSPGKTTATPALPETPAGSGEAKPAGTSVNLVGTTREIEIKPGSSGYSIGKLLSEEGFVSDTQTFIKRVEELGLGSKLRSGTFKLTTDMSLDEIIYKLSGQ